MWAVLLAVVALAATPDPRGWSEGTPAVNAGRVLAGLTDETAIDLPASVRPLLGDKTLLVYFSPSCPHCQRAQPELNALATRAGDRMKVVGVASGSASAGALAAYRVEYAVPYEMVADTDRSIAAAMGVRGTPSALLVRKKGDKTVIVDGWYPYQPGQDALIEMRVSPNPWEAFRPGEYQGNAVCAPCHTQESESWLLTHHSVAWDTLVKQRRDTDHECTGCHVVGAGQPTGWAGDGHSPLVDVGCEACHGPGGPHDGARVDAKTTCEGCHDAKHSIAFTVDKGLPLIDHYRSNTLDEAAWTAVRRTLLDGSAPRDLLAFPDGKHTGAASCASCHPTEHAQWADSPHAHAMATLSTDRTKAYKADAATSVECVSCHATANASGPPPATLDGYLVAESVGCESCHGPGETHVAAGGGKGNIQALGEGCPVCVLEAICTRCHTEKWDPTWNLDRKLPLVKHGAGG